MTPADKRAIERAASKVDMTPSEYLRASALTLMTLDLDPHALRTAARNARDLLRERLRELVGAVIGRTTL